MTSTEDMTQNGPQSGKGFTVKKRVLIFSGILTAAILLIAGLSLLTYSRTNQSFAQVEEIYSAEYEMAHLLRQFVVLKAHVREHLLGDLDGSTSLVPEELAAFEKQLGETKTHLGEQHQVNLAKLEVDALEFHKLYEQAELLKAEEQSLFLVKLKSLGAELEAAVHDIETAAINSASPSLAAQSAALMLQLMRGRLIANQIISSGNKVNLDQAEQAFAKSEVLIASLSNSTVGSVSRKASPISGKVADYSEALAEIMSVSAELHTIVEAEMIVAAATVEKDFETIMTALGEEGHQVAAEVEQSTFTTFLVNGTAAVLALIMCMLFARLVLRGITTPLTVLSKQMVQLSNGELDLKVAYQDKRDELGDLARELEAFRRAANDSDKLLGINTRIKVALDNCTTNIMLANTDGEIVYVNKSIEAMMHTAEADLRQGFQSFSADKLIGTSIEVFHKTRVLQSNTLASLNSVLSDKIQIGERDFDLIVNPVLDGNANRLGTVVEWADMTDERSIEREISKVVEAAVNGNFREKLALEGKQDFVLRLSQSINELCDTTANALDDVNDKLRRLSEGDLTTRVKTPYSGLFDELKNNLNDTAVRLSEIVSEVAIGAGEINNASAEITSGTTDLSERTEQQASNLEETSASMEEMAATIRQNAENAQQADQLVASASQLATRGGNVVTKAVDAMSRIESSSQKISDIIGVIDEIAFQTNLLALNAAVEAARAGDAGKGFAVVASEVRSLAQRSSGAAKDIKELIVQSGGQVTDGVDLVNNAGESLEEIVTSVKKVADIVSEIAAASREQATGVEEINKAVSQMDEMTQQNSSLVEENAAACRLLQGQAGNMSQRMSFFKTDATVTRQAQAPAVQMAPKVAAIGGGGGGAFARAGRGGAVALQENLAVAIHEDDDWKEF